jgi:hypothetical protein
VLRRSLVAFVAVALLAVLAAAAGADPLPPSAPEITGYPPAFSNSPDAAFAFESPEDVVFECRLEPADFAACGDGNPGTAEYTGLPEGQHTFDVRAVDKLDNVSDVASYSWTIDLVPPPSPTFTEEPPGVTNSGSADFSFASEGAASYICTLDGVSSTCDSPKTYSELSEGLHTLDVEALDAAGNKSLPATNTWTVDLTAPHPTVTSPAPGSATADPTPELLGTADAGPADDNMVTVDIYTGSSATGTPLETLTPPVSAGTWSAVPSSRLAAGKYTVQAMQSDSFARAGTSSPTTFTVDRTAPTVSLTRPRNGALTKNPTPTYRGSAGTSEGDLPEITVEVHQGSTASGPLVDSIPATAGGDGTWSVVQPTPLVDGKYAALAKQSDTAGKTGTSSVHVFTVDTTPPSPLGSATIRAGYGAVAIGWSRRADWKATDMLAIYRRLAGASVETRHLRVKTTASSWTDRRVQNGVRYQYDLVPIDRAGNRAPEELSKNARPTGFRTPKNGATLAAPIGISWVDVPKSDYSNIQVWRLRNSQLAQKMLSVWPRDNDYTLQARWRYQGDVYRLRSGRTYRVYGWPGFGSRAAADYGKSYGWVEFTVR